jgi:hypothetical protein
MTFQAPRRFWLEIASKTQPAYSFRMSATKSGRLLQLQTHELDIKDSLEAFPFQDLVQHMDLT